MRVDFLFAADETPLTKRFTRYPDGAIDVANYPQVRDFISSSSEVETLEALYEIIAAHASLNACMLKGTLDRPLKNESRAGHTQPNALTRWLLLDLDFVDGWQSLDAFLAELNPEWVDVSYIFQHSASAGIKGPAGLRGHVWLMLERAVQPSKLKRWLRERNLMIPALRQAAALTATGLGLRWPLDITSCQSDRLIYIAPPICIGLDDPLQERIALHPRGTELAPIPRTLLTEEQLEEQTQGLIDHLRTDRNLPLRPARYKTVGSNTLLDNPDPCEITGEKRERGFVYLNLNGGDSWGYFFPEGKPEILFNFKGEPVVRLRDIAPTYYERYTLEQRRQHFADVEPYVFRDPLTDTYYNVRYRPKTDCIELLAPARAKSRLTDFLADHGEIAPPYIPDWQLVFDPRTTEVIRPAERWINRFAPTDYIRYAASKPKPTRMPPIIARILISVCGDDMTVLDHFLNWLACVFQTRKPTQTAWVFHGVQGTGKGLLFSKILQPLLGYEHTLEWKLQNLEDKFNAPLARTCLLWLDEFQFNDAKNGDLVMSKLKNLVTEPELTIRGMRAEAVQLPNYLNIIIVDNRPCPIQLSEHDRRFNIAPAQERPIEILENGTFSEVDQIEDELWEFAAYLAHYPADAARARKPLKNAARQAMIKASQTTVDQFFTAIRNGDFDWFANYLQADPPAIDLLSYQAFEITLGLWAERLMEEQESPGWIRLEREELRSLYRYIINNVPSPSGFTRMCHIHRVTLFRTMYQKQHRTVTRVPVHDDDRSRASQVLKLLAKRPFSVIQGGLSKPHQEDSP